jgi:hypothetical protein
MVAKDICDYQGIDVSHLDSTMKYGMNVTEGKLNKQYNIFGYQTRKSFLDKLTGKLPEGDRVSEFIRFQNNESYLSKLIHKLEVLTK